MDIDDEFVKKYDGLVTKLVKQSRFSGEDFDRLKAAVWIRVIQSNNYNPDKGKVSTWLWYVGRSAIGNELKLMNRSQDALDHSSLTLEAASNVIGSEDAGTDRDELDRLFASSTVSQRDESIVKDIPLRGMTYEEAAEKHGLNFQAVKKVVFRTMKALRQVAAAQP